MEPRQIAFVSLLAFIMAIFIPSGLCLFKYINGYKRRNYLLDKASIKSWDLIGIFNEVIAFSFLMAAFLFVMSFIGMAWGWDQFEECFLESIGLFFIPMLVGSIVCITLIKKNLEHIKKSHTNFNLPNFVIDNIKDKKSWIINSNKLLIAFYSILLGISIIIASLSIPLTQYLGRQGKYIDYFTYTVYVVLMFIILLLLFLVGLGVLIFAIQIEIKFNNYLLFLKLRFINWMDTNCKQTFNVKYKRQWYEFCLIVNIITIFYFAITIFINSYWPEFAMLIQLEWTYLWYSWFIAITFFILNMITLWFSIRISKELKLINVNKLRAYIWITYGISITVIIYNFIITIMEMLLTDESEITFITSYDILFLVLTIISNLGFKTILSLTINVTDNLKYRIIQINYK